MNVFAKTILVSVMAFGLWCAPSAQAITHSMTGIHEGQTVSATADFTLDPEADTITIKLTNTTPFTHNAGQLLTGLDFTLGGLTPTLDSALGVTRVVARNGSFTDSAGPVSLSWGVVSPGGSRYQLNFNPDAEHAIIGAPFDSDYADTNGSIKGNAGHNPFAAEMATFVLNAGGLTAEHRIGEVAFRFGTDLSSVEAIPEPVTAGLSILGLSALVFATRRRHPA